MADEYVFRVRIRIELTGNPNDTHLAQLQPHDIRHAISTQAQDLYMDALRTDGTAEGGIDFTGKKGGNA